MLRIMAQNDNLDYFDIAEFDDNPFEEEYQSHSVEYSDLEDDDMNMVICDGILILMIKISNSFNYCLNR